MAGEDQRDAREANVAGLTSAFRAKQKRSAAQGLQQRRVLRPKEVPVAAAAAPVRRHVEREVGMAGKVNRQRTGPVPLPTVREGAGPAERSGRIHAGTRQSIVEGELIRGA